MTSVFSSGIASTFEDLGAINRNKLAIINPMLKTKTTFPPLPSRKKVFSIYLSHKDMTYISSNGGTNAAARESMGYNCSFSASTSFNKKLDILSIAGIADIPFDLKLN